MKFRLPSVARAALAALLLSPALCAPAQAANYAVKDGLGANQTFCSVVVAGAQIPCHLMEGLFGGTATAVNMTNAGALDVTVTGGTVNLGTLGGAATAAKQPALGTAGSPSSDVITVQGADIRPAAGTITAADAGTTTTSGQSSVALVSGTPTANSFQTQALNAQSSATITTTGTFVATLQIEASYNGGTTYVPVSGLLRGTSQTTASITGPGVVSLDVTGATHLRVRASAYTSGTPTVQMAFSNAPGMTKILNALKLVDSLGGDVTNTTGHTLKVTNYTGAGTEVDPNAALPAGTNVLGKVGIDQTTNGTTNKVYSDIEQIAGNGVLTGNGITGTGSMRVTIAADNSEVPTKVADGSNVTFGAKADAVCGTATGTCSIAALVKYLNTAVNSSIPAGSAIIGKVTTDQTTHGTTDLVAADLTKIGGTAVLTGTGAQGAGSQRVTVATDSATVAGTAPSAANASVTENPVLTGCEFKTTTTAATTGQKQFQACGDGFGNQGKSFTPAMATQITAQSATTANTANTATLAAAASKFTYISGFACTSGGATSAALVTVTVAGLITGSITYTMGIPAGVTAAAVPLVVSFPNPVQGSAVNTAITVQIGAAGSGNTVEQCNAQGFQQ